MAAHTHTHRRLLAGPSAGNYPCVRAFLLEVQQQRNKGLQSPLLPHHHLRTGYLRCQPCGKKHLKLRRDGRPLNNQLFIQDDATKGKQGRIVPITVMHFDTMTNYGAAGSLRRNFDNQSLLYVPPGSVWKLLHSPNIGCKPEYAHMERKEGDMNPKWLLSAADGSVGTDEVDAHPSDDIETCDALLTKLESECLSAFRDAHNTGFYINEYTTKVNALGDKILEGLRMAS